MGEGVKSKREGNSHSKFYKTTVSVSYFLKRYHLKSDGTNSFPNFQHLLIMSCVVYLCVIATNNNTYFFRCHPSFMLTKILRHCVPIQIPKNKFYSYCFYQQENKILHLMSVWISVQNDQFNLDGFQPLPYCRTPWIFLDTPHVPCAMVCHGTRPQLKCLLPFNASNSFTWLSGWMYRRLLCVKVKNRWIRYWWASNFLT